MRIQINSSTRPPVFCFYVSLIAMHDAMIDQTRRIFFPSGNFSFPQRAGRSVRDSSTEMKLCPPSPHQIPPHGSLSSSTRPARGSPSDGKINGGVWVAVGRGTRGAQVDDPATCVASPTRQAGRHTSASSGRPNPARPPHRVQYPNTRHRSDAHSTE